MLSVHQPGSAGGDDVGGGKGRPAVFGRPTRAGLDGRTLGGIPRGGLLFRAKVQRPGVRRPAKRDGGFYRPPHISAGRPNGRLQRTCCAMGVSPDGLSGRGTARVGGGEGVLAQEPLRRDDVPRSAGRVGNRLGLGQPRGRRQDVTLPGGGGGRDVVRPFVRSHGHLRRRASACPSSWRAAPTLGARAPRHRRGPFSLLRGRLASYAGRRAGRPR